MKASKPLEMNLIDRISTDRYGIPGIVLMENAALKVVSETNRILDKIEGKSILLIAGKGNNGGDALAAARHLYHRQAAVTVCLLCRPEEVKGDALINLNTVQRLGIPFIPAEDADIAGAVESALPNCNLVIDGLYGTGFKGQMTGMAATVARLVNKSGVKVLSVDIPSGVNGETGEISEDCFRADVTVTFGLPKTGLLVHPGCGPAGKLVIADIGLPAAAVDGAGIMTELIDADDIRKTMPARRLNSNKGSYGKALLITSSNGMTGAGCLTARACLRSGAGLVYLAGPASLVPVFGAQVAEAVAIPLEDGGQGILKAACLPKLKERVVAAHAVAVGPGLSVNSDITVIVEEVLKTAECPLILDADALNVISQDTGMLKYLHTNAVLTPHPGEMARLARTTIADIQNNRIDAAREFARRWCVTVVLKGFRTVVAAPDGRIFINATGNSGLATAGTGDVLTGLITGLAAQGTDTVDAARAGVYLHGLAGDLAAAEKGEYGMIAGDVAEAIPLAVKKLTDGTATDFFERV